MNLCLCCKNLKVSRKMHKKNEIWLANLDPRFGTEAGKTRPVLIVQTDLLNHMHPSTLVCPLTTNIQPESKILRVHLQKGVGKVERASDIMIDQLRAIDNKKLVKKLGEVPREIVRKVHENILLILDAN
jgi:mRNA interferase MazF